MIKSILVAVSGTPFSESAVRHAVELARQHGAEITGVTDIDLRRVASLGPVPIGAGEAAAELMEERLHLTQQHVEEAVRSFESACDGAGVRSTVVRETGTPFETLIGLWRYHDLTIAGLRGIFEYGVYHNPDDLLLRLIARGVRPIVAVARTYRPVKRVLVAYNGSMEAAKALKYFMQTRPWPEVTVKIVCFDRAKEDADTLLADAARYCALHGVEAQRQRLEGPVRDGLLEHAASWGADLVVMGSTSRARILQHLLGDTALHALRHAEIPLYLTQ
jgi:nucleotide-binding universal stress UspA family protein